MNYSVKLYRQLFTHFAQKSHFTLAENSDIKNGNLQDATLVALNDYKHIENSKEPTDTESRDIAEDNDITIVDDDFELIPETDDLS